MTRCGSVQLSSLCIPPEVGTVGKSTCRRVELFIKVYEKEGGRERESVREVRVCVCVCVCVWCINCSACEERGI